MPKQRKVKIGIVGQGHRGRALINTFRMVRECEVTALCEKYGRLLEMGLEAAAEAGIEGAQGYRDFEQMLREAELEAVAVIVAPHEQPDLICRALEAGKHVLSEVPAAYTIEDCWRIVLAVEKAGLKFQLAEQLRYSAWANAWKQLVAGGKLGKVLYAEGQYLHGMPDNFYYVDAETGEPVPLAEAPERRVVRSRFWYMPHPILYLPHELAPLLHILDDRVKSVTCMSTRRRSYRYDWLPVPDLEVALMHTHKDTLLRLMTGFVVEFAPRTEHCNRLIGTGGWVEQDRDSMERGKLWLAEEGRAGTVSAEWRYEGDELPPEMAGVSVSAGELLEVGRSGHGGLDYYPVATFVDSILRDTRPPMDVYVAADTAAPAILAGQSVERGSVRLGVPEFRPGKHRRSGEPPASLSPEVI